MVNVKKRYILVFFLLSILSQSVFSQTTKVKKVLFQTFWWDYKNTNYPNGWANYLAELAPRLKQIGVDAVWIPPSYKNQAPSWVGYGPMDHYDLGDKYQKGGGPPNVKTGLGTKDELLRMIAVMHANGIEVIQDVVLNHVDGAGTTTGEGGIDPATMSMASNSGYKNFRYSCYATPAIDESQNDYWTRRGRWAKNYMNFHPNDNDNCSSGDICAPYFGPDIDYTSNSNGLSSNIPTSGVPSGYPATRPYYNPAQASNYMYNGAKDWISWFKKQTGVDGFRWDAVKHFDSYVQRDLTRQAKYHLGAAANGGYSMTNIGEWIGQTGDLDAYVVNVAAASLGDGYEEHTGTFDFNLRGYGSSGGIYSMVLAQGGYNMQSIYGDQQGKRYYDYGSPSARVHRTIPFVNSHDTYRPKLNPSTGDFSTALGDGTGWDSGNELGGNGGHLDPREPRMAAAYATIFAMDGNPVIFFEDVFNIGTTGQRWTHDPKSSSQLPLWNDIDNISKCHQKLGFKDGDYGVPSALTGSSGPYYQNGVAEDHVVFERKGKAIIGVTDFYNTATDNSQDQEVWVSVDASLANTDLYDYSGAHGITPTHVQNDGRVLIKTAPVGHKIDTIAGAKGHGYSVWAPAPSGVAPTSISDLFNYLDTYTPPRAAATNQEWEMDDDLGDSNCSSLGQGGRTPDNSPNDRVAGKIYAASGTTVSYTVTLGTAGSSIAVDFYDLSGTLLNSTSGSTATITGSFSNTSTRWITVKVRNTTATTLGQKCYINVTYTAPSVVTTASALATTLVSIWTSNGGSNDWNDCHNWEEGIIPTCSGTVIIPHTVKFMPKVASCFTGTLINRAGLTLKAKAFLQGPYNSSTGLMNDALRSLPSFPTTTPYGGTETIDPSVLTITGNDAIVDWIKVELRDKTTPATVLSTRSALLQRDGDIVETDGVSPLFLNGVSKSDYFVAIKHRNHLGAMSATYQTFLDTPLSMNFTTNASYGTNGQKNVSSIYCLWAGNVISDPILKYSGSSNDRLPILQRIGGVNVLNTTSGYYVEDVNLDGTVRYSGSSNDRLIILQNIGGTNVLSTISQQTPN